MFSIYAEKKKEIPILAGLRSPLQRSKQPNTHNSVPRVANLLWMQTKRGWGVELGSTEKQLHLWWEGDVNQLPNHSATWPPQP